MDQNVEARNFNFCSTVRVHAFWQTACCKNRVLKFQHSKICIQ
eukprot:COSAG05_NODE_19258_length_295_cov_0.903061_1_plen_42_part_10